MSDMERERRELQAEVERLRRWKAEATEVILGLQDLGKALGLRLGERITGASATEAAKRLTERADKAEADNEWLRQEARAEAAHADPDVECPVCTHLSIEQQIERAEAAEGLAEQWRDKMTDAEDRAEKAEAKVARLRDALRRRLGTPWPGKSEWWADVAALMNDRGDMWETGNRPVLASECRGLANAFRTYAEGVGIPQMDTLRRKRREAEAKVARVEAICADPDFANGHVSVVRIRAALDGEATT